MCTVGGAFVRRSISAERERDPRPGKRDGIQTPLYALLSATSLAPIERCPLRSRLRSYYNIHTAAKIAKSEKGQRYKDLVGSYGSLMYSAAFRNRFFFYLLGSRISDKRSVAVHSRFFRLLQAQLNGVTSEPNCPSQGEAPAEA